MARLGAMPQTLLGDVRLGLCVVPAALGWPEVAVTTGVMAALMIGFVVTCISFKFSPIKYSHLDEPCKVVALIAVGTVCLVPAVYFYAWLLVVAPAAFMAVATFAGVARLVRNHLGSPANVSRRERDASQFASHETDAMRREFARIVQEETW